MTLWVQNLVVIIAVIACAGFLVRGAWNTLSGKRSKLGSCCAKGCAAHETPNTAKPAERIQFIPVEMLGRKK
jgi:hypothetical protein